MILMKKDMYFLHMNKMTVKVLNIKSFTWKQVKTVILTESFQLLKPCLHRMFPEITRNILELIFEINDFPNNTALFKFGVTY